MSNHLTLLLYVYYFTCLQPVFSFCHWLENFSIEAHGHIKSMKNYTFWIIQQFSLSFLLWRHFTVWLYHSIAFSLIYLLTNCRFFLLLLMQTFDLLPIFLQSTGFISLKLSIGHNFTPFIFTVQQYSKTFAYFQVIQHPSTLLLFIFCCFCHSLFHFSVSYIYGKPLYHLRWNIIMQVISTIMKISRLEFKSMNEHVSSSIERQCCRQRWHATIFLVYTTDVIYIIKIVWVSTAQKYNRFEIFKFTSYFNAYFFGSAYNMHDEIIVFKILLSSPAFLTLLTFSSKSTSEFLYRNIFYITNFEEFFFSFLNPNNINTSTFSGR